LSPGNSCTFKWIRRKNGKVPKNAVIGGHDENQKKVYICRVMIEYNRKNVPSPVNVR